MYTFVTIAVAITVLSTVSCQRYQSEGGYNSNEYSDYDGNRPAHPTPRSYGSAPAQRAEANAGPKPTPVAILKQINRHNEDGSYTYGFEGGDGSFKIETKLPTGEVRGKYGFVDDGGKVRVVEYGANQYGFQPSGEGITVAPPTLIDDTTGKDGLSQDYQDYPQPAAPAARPPPPPPPQRPAYQPPQNSHTQAYYPQQSRAPLPKPPIFTPADRQSPILRPSAYDESAPPSQAYNQGPVQFSPAPVQESRPHPQTRSQPGGILDQLARDYALPQGVAAPLHDISFGYY